MIGACGCGAQQTNLRISNIKALIDRGVVEPICAACEQRILAKLQTRKIAEMRKKGAAQKDIDAAVAELAQKVTKDEPLEIATPKARVTVTPDAVSTQ